MKRRFAIKKIVVIMMTFLLTVVMFPNTDRTVHAAGPSSDRFVSADELLTYNTAKPQSSLKIYFGKDKQQWWIAGSQKENTLVLFAANPLGAKQKFSDIGTKSYDASWSCDYENGNVPQDVSANHYGGSKARADVSALEASYFTQGEQALMNETLLYNKDIKNNSTYSVSDRLYLPYADPETELVTVGTNDKDDLKSGLTVDPSYFSSVLFETRTPNSKENFVANGSKIGYMPVFVHRVDNDADLLPAFELEISSVLFGSVVPAASADGAVSESDAFTLRYEGDVGQAVIDASQTKVSISSVTEKSQDTYLVVQSSESSWVKKVSSNDQLTVQDLTNDTLTTLQDCKVWLETTDADRMTSATFARTADPVSPQQPVDQSKNQSAKQPAEPSEVPETGSNSDYLLWIVALCLSSAAIVCLLKKRVKY